VQVKYAVNSQTAALMVRLIASATQLVTAPDFAPAINPALTWLTARAPPTVLPATCALLEVVALVMFVCQLSAVIPP